MSSLLQYDNFNVCRKTRLLMVSGKPVKRLQCERSRYLKCFSSPNEFGNSVREENGKAKTRKHVKSETVDKLFTCNNIPRSSLRMDRKLFASNVSNERMKLE
ncbi:hypothetical protein L6164_003061 [Bauhinia variegata]|uniref:Uncharacterized protein n=1 Tax=Bauhinia variegata TaxID=167791 RepID=A0ACB9Q0A4_BAUVA|nr:hypothetical protein L6164_003061 [Bauhinia variegata]